MSNSIFRFSPVSISLFVRRCLQSQTEGRQGWASQFETNYDAHAAANRDMRDNRRQRDSQRRIKRAIELDSACGTSPNNPQCSYDDTRFRADANFINEMIKKRVTEGWTFHPGYVGGRKPYWRDKIKVDGHLYSENSPIRKLFVASLPKKVCSGHSKSSVIESPRHQKVLALDDEYVECNKLIRSVLRVEVDAVFTSVNEINENLRTRNVKPPNFVVGWVDKSGKFHNPHLIWLLRNGVNFCPGGMRKFQSKFNHVLRSLTEALQDIGADPGGLSNSFRMKNPLCPRWDTFCLNETGYSLNELADGLPTTASARRQDIDDFAYVGDSNSFFHALRLSAWGKCRKFKECNDLSGFIKLVEGLALELSDLSGKSAESALAMSARIIDYTWAKFDVRKCSNVERTDTHRPCAAETAGKSLRESKQIGGRYAARQRTVNCMRKLTDAYYTLVESGVTSPSCKLLSEVAGVATSSAEKYRKQIIANIDPAMLSVKKVSSCRHGEKKKTIEDSQACISGHLTTNPDKINSNLGTADNYNSETQSCPHNMSSDIETLDVFRSDTNDQGTLIESTGLNENSHITKSFTESRIRCNTECPEIDREATNGMTCKTHRERDESWPNDQLSIDTDESQIDEKCIIHEGERPATSQLWILRRMEIDEAKFIVDNAFKISNLAIPNRHFHDLINDLEYALVDESPLSDIALLISSDLRIHPWTECPW